MNSNLLAALKKKRVLLSDGAMGTQLQAKGLAVGECPESWNETRPQAVTEIAREYFEAGSDMVLTNTFGANGFKLKKYNAENKVETYNRLGVELARKAAPEAGLVVASVGPTGDFLQPVGEVSETEMAACFAEQVRALAKAEADGILAETLTALEEAIVIIKVIRDHCDLPAMATMTFDKSDKGFRTMMGVSVEQAADELQKAGAQVIGANCGNGIEQMIEIVKILKVRSDVPILVHANAGVPEIVEGKTVFRETPQKMAAKLPELLDAGAALAGGCCGTNPEHIRAFRKAIDAWLNGKK